MSYQQEFINTFKPLLTAQLYKKGEFDRWIGFEYIVKNLLNMNKPLYIVETGTLNSDNNWLGFGQSTMIWDWLISKTKGIVNSVDIDLNNIKFARSKCNNINFVHCDSVGYLRGLDENNIDLLYLDSYNWSKEDHISSCLHHMTELGAIWDRLPKNCIIAVDDRHNDLDGKHALVELFFTNIIKIQPVIRCHMIIWVKP